MSINICVLVIIISIIASTIISQAIIATQLSKYTNKQIELQKIFIKGLCEKTIKIIKNNTH